VAGAGIAGITGCLEGIPSEDEEEEEEGSSIQPEYVRPVGDAGGSSNPEGGSLAGAAMEVPDEEPEWSTSNGVAFDLWYLAENQEYDTLEEESEPDHTDSDYDLYIYNGGEYEIEIETGGDDELRESTPGGLWKFPSEGSGGYEIPDGYGVYVLDGDGGRVGSVVLDGEDAHGHEVWMYGEATEPHYLLGIW